MELQPQHKKHSENNTGYDQQQKMQAKQVNNKEVMLNTMFDGLGLNLATKLNKVYGKKYSENPVDKASGYSGCIKCCGLIPKVLCVVCAPCDCGPTRIITTGNIGLLMEFGRLVQKLPPGLHSINNCSQTLLVVDIRTKVLDIKPQVLMTKDNITVKIDGFITYKVVCPELAYFTVNNFLNLLINMSKGLLKTVVVERTLTQLLQDRDEIAEQITSEIDKQTSPFGVKVISIDIQQVDLPLEMEAIMAKVATSKIEAEAKIIDAQGNLDCAKCYRKSADLFKENPVSLRLQYMEVLQQISAENNKTYIVPQEILKLINK